MWSSPWNLPYKEDGSKILSYLGSCEPDVLHPRRVPDFGHISPGLALRPVQLQLTVEVQPSYSVPFKEESNQKEMYLCFLGWWEIFHHFPPRLLSPLLCWPASCWDGCMVVGVMREREEEWNNKMQVRCQRGQGGERKTEAEEGGG